MRQKEEHDPVVVQEIEAAAAKAGISDDNKRIVMRIAMVIMDHITTREQQRQILTGLKIWCDITLRVNDSSN
jgi:hypothetical protein